MALEKVNCVINWMGGENLIVCYIEWVLRVLIMWYIEWVLREFIVWYIEWLLES